MKRTTFLSRFLLVVAALFPYSTLFAQPDTLFITHNTTAYLLFAEQVNLVDIGNSSEYISEIEGKCVFIKAAKEGAAPTSILVQHGEEYFVALLAYKPLSKKFLYDYRKKASIGNVTGKRTKSDENIDFEKVRQHFHAFQKLPQAVSRKSVRRNHLRLSLTGLENDKGATYIRFTLENDSSIDYMLDLITFERKQKRGKRFSENNVNRAFIEPWFSSSTKVIGAKGKEHLHFAIPLYALGAKSYVTVTLREKNGARLLSIKLPARYINQAPVFQF